jgi:hypothetical protein
MSSVTVILSFDVIVEIFGREYFPPVLLNLLLLLLLLLLIFNYALQLLRLILRFGLDVPTFATRRIHACHQLRTPSGG